MAIFACATPSRRITVVVGINSAPANNRVVGDRMLAAWQDGRLNWITRKAFPSSGDTNRKKHNYAVHPSDYSDSSRIITLSNGRQAILCSCYDAFGVRAFVDPNFADWSAIKTRLKRSGEAKPFKQEQLIKAFEDWFALLQARPPDIALVAIHRFSEPGRDGLWQRHGLAGASAALNGIPVLGAAHFVKALPKGIAQSPLAATRVPQSHLLAGPNRKAHPHKPTCASTVRSKHSRPIAIVRCFSLPNQPQGETP